MGASSAHRPICGSRSERVHSPYIRTVSELPWHGIAVGPKVRTRKFFCAREQYERRIFCEIERRIFCEMLVEIAARVRKTARLKEALLTIARCLGGEASARLVRALG